MPETYAAIDIETTGLDPATDKIIEVGIVKFTDSQIPTAWSSLVNPDIFIPTPILQLTRIPLADIRASPPIEDLTSHILAFVGDAIPIAHRAEFEQTFFTPLGISFLRPWQDTLDIARAQYPLLEHHTLTALSEHLAIPYPVKHRALPDADFTRKLYLHMQGLPYPELPPALVWQGTVERLHITLKVQEDKPVIIIRGI